MKTTETNLTELLAAVRARDVQGLAYIDNSWQGTLVLTPAERDALCAAADKIASLETELRELRKAHNAAWCEVTALRDYAERVREGLDHHGVHGPHCYDGVRACVCRLNALLNEPLPGEVVACPNAVRQCDACAAENAKPATGTAEESGGRVAGPCDFDEAWRGRCKEPRPCAKHGNKVCIACGRPATRSCSFTGQFVCGQPLCNDCRDIEPDEAAGAGFFGMRHTHGPKAKPEKPRMTVTWWIDDDGPQVELVDGDARLHAVRTDGRWELVEEHAALVPRFAAWAARNDDMLDAEIREHLRARRDHEETEEWLRTSR